MGTSDIINLLHYSEYILLIAGPRIFLLVITVDYIHDIFLLILSVLNLEDISCLRRGELS